MSLRLEFISSRTHVRVYELSKHDQQYNNLLSEDMEFTP